MNIINIGDDDVIKVGDKLMKGTQYKNIIEQQQKNVLYIINGYKNIFGDYRFLVWNDDIKLMDGSSHDKFYNKYIKFFTINLKEHQIIAEKTYKFVKPHFKEWSNIKILIKFDCYFLSDFISDTVIYDNFNKYQLTSDDVVDLGNNELYTGWQFMYELKHLFRQLFREIYTNQEFNKLIRIEQNIEEIGASFIEILESEDCNFLQLGSGAWKTGKIQFKISLELIPESPEITQYESPLDDIRKMIKNGEINSKI